MGGIAVLARELGHQVSGSDNNVYPPMSTQLEALGISLATSDDLAQLTPEPDLIVVGNALSRGNPVVEAILDRKMKYISGPQWLADYILCQRESPRGCRHPRQNHYRQYGRLDIGISRTAARLSHWRSSR